MNLAIPFKLNNEKYDEVADEFNLKFNSERNSEEKLIEFAETYQDHRINIEMDIVDSSLLSVLSKVHPRIYVRLTRMSDMTILSELRKKKIKFFFDSEAYTATSITSLIFLISIGVSDVYIADDLCYDLENTAEIAHGWNVQLRLVLNVVAMTVPPINEEKSPWFPPEATDILAKYIDTIEFDCGDPYDWHRFGVFYRAWLERKTWHGNLNEIIYPLTIDIPNDSFLADELIRYKVNCRRHCSAASRSCTRCQSYVDLANELAEREIGLNKKWGKKEES